MAARSDPLLSTAPHGPFTFQTSEAFEGHPALNHYKGRLGHLLSRMLSVLGPACHYCSLTTSCSKPVPLIASSAVILGHPVHVLVGHRKSKRGFYCYIEPSLFHNDCFAPYCQWHCLLWQMSCLTMVSQSTCRELAQLPPWNCHCLHLLLTPAAQACRFSGPGWEAHIWLRAPLLSMWTAAYQTTSSSAPFRLLYYLPKSLHTFHLLTSFSFPASIIDFFLIFTFIWIFL